MRVCACVRACVRACVCVCVCVFVCVCVGLQPTTDTLPAPHVCTHPHPLLSPLSLSLLSLSLSAVCLTQALICRCEIVCGPLRGGPLCDPTGRESVPGRCPVWSLSLIPPVLLGVRLWRLRSQGGELIPLSNQLSGAVGERASSALISIVKASLRAVFRGGSFVDGTTGAGPRRRQCCGDASGWCGEWLAARCDGEELVSSHAKGLCSVET